MSIHPDYPRRFDLEVQLPLIDPDIKIVDSLRQLFIDVVVRLDLKLK